MVVLRDLSLSFLLRRDDPAKHGEGSWGYRALSLWSIVAIVAFLFVMFKEHNTQHEHRTAQNTDDEGAHVGCQSGLRPRDTPLGLILFLVSTRLPIP